MTAFRCMPMPTAIAHALRAGPADEMGNAIETRVDGTAGYPCRHCLAEATEGEPMLLAAYRLPRPIGLYWTPSPIFLHADACPAFDAPDTLPPIVRPRRVSLRAYDADERMLYDLGAVVEGMEAEVSLVRALGDPRARYINIHTAGAGCFLCVAVRA